MKAFKFLVAAGAALAVGLPTVARQLLTTAAREPERAPTALPTTRAADPSLQGRFDVPADAADRLAGAGRTQQRRADGDIYFNDFSDLGASMTIINANGDNQTWKPDNGAMTVYFNRTKAMDDWMVSPAVQLEAGKVYEVSVDAWCKTRNIAESFEVRLGRDTTVAAMTVTVIADTAIKHQDAVTYTGRVTVPAGGAWHVGVHATSPADTYGLYCDNLRVAVGAETGAPMPVSGLTAEPLPLEKKARISCTAPSADVLGNQLASLTKIEFWRGATSVRTFESPVPGQQLSFVDDCGMGKHTYKAVAYSPDGESEAATATVIVVDARQLPYHKTFLDAGCLDEMTVIDANGDGSSWIWKSDEPKYAKLECPKTGSDDDWLITPPLALRAGKVYEWSSLVTAGNPGAFPPRLRVCVGTAPSAAAMTQELLPPTTLTAYDTPFEKSFTVPADGLYYLGIQGCSRKWLAIIKVNNIDITGGSDADAPGKVSDLIAEPDWSGRTGEVRISFKAPVATGSGGSLSSLSRIEVLRDGVVCRTFDAPAPGAELRHTDTPAAAGLYTYAVVAYSSDEPGARAEAEVAVGVPGKSVPYLEDFKSGDREERFAEFTIVDANGDGLPIWHAYASKPGHIWLFNPGNGASADDYAITPGISLEKGVRYSIGADAWGTDEGFRLLVGTAPAVDSLSSVVVPLTALPGKQKSFSGTFTAPYSGKFYVGVHAFTEAGKRKDDFHATDIRVEKIGMVSCPAAVGGFTAVADPDGAARLTLRFTAPDTDLEGSPLQGLTKIEVSRAGSVVKVFDSPAPGARLEYTDAPGAAGEYAYSVTPYNEAGAGEKTDYLGYAGPDAPAAPANVVATYLGDGKVKVTWDPVTTTAHGAVTSDIPVYLVLENDGNDERQLVQTAECEYTYKALADPDAGQKRFAYGIFPFSSVGKQGEYGLSNTVFAGAAYRLPFTESFPGGYPGSPILVENMKLNPEWHLCTDATFNDAPSADGDNGFIAQKGVINSEGRLSTGKISLVGVNCPALSFQSFNINPADYTNRIAVEVREAGSETWTRVCEKTIREEVAAKGWGRITVDLSAYKGKEIHIGMLPVIQYRTGSSSSYYQWTMLDALRVYNRADRDLSVAVESCPADADPGAPLTFRAKVTNNGEQAAQAYAVKLYKDGILAETVPGSALASGASAGFEFHLQASVADPDEISLEAVAEMDGDENTADNTTGIVKVRVSKPVWPAVSSLAAAERTGTRGTVDVSWGAPDLSGAAPAPYTEGFESAESWNRAGACGWAFVDVDSLGVAGFDQFDFPGLTKDGTTKASFFVVDRTASELGRYATLFAGNGGSDKTIGSLLSRGGTTDDWAVSPALYGGPQTVSFYAKCLQASMPEKAEVWYSTGSADPSDFIFVKDFDVTSTTWTRFSAYLPDGAARVAIRKNFQGGMLLVDDISLRRLGDAPEQLVLKGYNVYRDGAPLNAEPVQGLGYVDTGVEGGTHVYAVTPVYDKGEGNSRRVTGSFLSVGATGVSEASVVTLPGEIVVLDASGAAVSVTALDGTVICRRAGSDRMSVKVAPGVYVVCVADATFKVAVR